MVTLREQNLKKSLKYIEEHPPCLDKEHLNELKKHGFNPNKSAKMLKTLPKSIVHNGTKFNLLDIQYSKSNAEFAGQIFANRLPKARFVINDELVNGRPVWGIYTTMKVSNTVEKKKR